MLDMLEAIVGALNFWGFYGGMAVAALIAWLVSYLIGSAFSYGLFGVLCIPCCVIGLYLQWQSEAK